jgi:hypothetical protein
MVEDLKYIVKHSGTYKTSQLLEQKLTPGTNHNTDSCIHMSMSTLQETLTFETPQASERPKAEIKILGSSKLTTNPVAAYREGTKSQPDQQVWLGL